AAPPARNSVVCEIPAEAVARLVADDPAFATRLGDLAAAREAAYAEGEAAFHREQAHDNRRDEKRKLTAELGARLRDVFAGGVTRTLIALVTGGTGNGKKAALLDALMAGTALVATAEGEIEAEERVHVECTLRSLDLPAQAGVEIETAMTSFDAHCTRIADDPQAGVARALEAVGRVARDRTSAELVADTCVAVSAADGEAEPDEESRLAEIRAVLNVGGGDDVEG
ncbi:MAG: TerB family tellurite resistance protein, partial [Rhodospirillaceae bacterium]